MATRASTAPPHCGQIYIYGWGFCELVNGGNDLFQSHPSHRDIMAFKNTEFPNDPLIPAKMGFFFPFSGFPRPKQQDRNRNHVPACQAVPVWWADEVGWEICVPFSASNTEANLCPAWFGGWPCQGQQGKGMGFGHSQGPAWCSQA